MVRTIRDMVIGAIVVAGIGAAAAVVGTPPGTGPALVDGSWLNGVIGGSNFSYQYGITAHAGGTQAACFVLPTNTYLLEVDTVGTAADSVCLPFAQQGMNLSLRNAAASNALDMYGQSANNPLTGSADTINGTAGSTVYPSGGLAAGSSVECFAVKNGVWSCVHGN